MPRTVTVTFGDGSTHVYQNVPDDVTPDSVIQRASKEFGNKPIVNLDGGKPAAAAEMPEAPPKPKGPTFDDKLRSSLPLRVWQGMRDPIDAGAQFLPWALEKATSVGGLFPNRVSDFFGSEAKRVNEGVVDAEKKYQAARAATGQDGFDFARLTGNVVSPANAAIASRVPIAAGMSLPQLAARGAAAGAAGGLLTPVTNLEDGQSYGGVKAAQVGLGAVTGGALTPPLTRASEAVGRFLQRYLQNPEVVGARASLQTDDVIRKALAEVGQDPAAIPELDMRILRQQVVDAMKNGKKVDGAALLRQQDFKALGVQPTAGQITRDATQFARERNLRGVEGVGEPLQNLFTTQNQRLSEVLGGYGGPRAAPAYQAGNTLIDTLRTVDKNMGKEVTGAYQAAREATGREATVPLTGLAQDYAAIIRDFGEANIPGAIRSRLAETGITGGKQLKQFTQNDAEQLLQAINKNYDPMRKAESAALDALRGAVKSAVTAGDETGGVFSQARQLASKRFQIQEAVPALQAAADGRVPPDDFVRRFILNGKTDEVKNMTKLLSGTSPEAMQEARNQVGAYLARAAFGENVTGDKLFSPERFAKALREMGPDKLKAFFSPEEVTQLQRLGRVGAYINSQPVAAAVNYSNTAGAALNLLSRIPGVPLAAQVLSNASRSLEQRNVVNRALAAQVPVSPAELAPEAQRLLYPGLLGLAYGSGAAAATPLR
jgi:hypothetical protein